MIHFALVVKPWELKTHSVRVTPGNAGYCTCQTQFGKVGDEC